MEQEYKLLTGIELLQKKDDFNQMDEAQYSVIKKLYAYMKEYGAVREDVYDYLLEHKTFEEYSSLAILNNLIKTFAGPEWFALIKEVEQRKIDFLASTGSILLFEQLILEAYREDIPFEYIVQRLREAKYPYEFNQKLEQYRKKKQKELETQIEELKTTIEKFTNNNQEYIEPPEQFFIPELNEDSLIEEPLEEFQEIESESQQEDSSVLLLIQKLLTENKNQYKDLTTLKNFITKSGKEFPISIVKEDEALQELEVKEDSEIGKEEVKEEVLASKQMIVEEKEHSKNSIHLVKMFQKLRKWKKTIDFHKLTDKQKLEELFKKMNEKLYSEKMIVMIRECIALGVSFEFLYTLIEMDAGAEEFEKLILFRSTENYVTERVEHSKKKEIEKEKNELEQREIHNEEPFYYENISEMEYMGGDVWNGVE